MPFLLCADFSLFPDNTPLGPSFTLSATDFADVQPAQSASFVNDTNGQLGLQFPDTGLDANLPLVVQWARLRIGQFNTPFTIEGFDGRGSVVSSYTTSVPGYTNLTIRATGLERLEFRGGGSEGVLVSLCVIV